MPLRVCLVCLGNICRSPTAEAVLRERAARAGLSRELRIESAGTGGHHEGERADPRSREHGARRGYDLRGRARRFHRDDFARFDLVLAMDASNASALRRLAPDAAAREKVRLFRSFDPSAAPGAEVPDPYYGGPAGFDEVIDLCERAADGLIAEVARSRPRGD
ncbi:MAG: low molecular weight phosphotyrosine protein phosphatase [Polyangiaceae bacterium]|nr:low molecular weight phosphotyrosine protein phosphatase [Polyangiaceae bacterium]